MADTMDCTADNTQLRLSPLQTIPLEILLRISSYLPTPDLGNFRLTCRGLEQSLFKNFTDEFFTRKQFMFSEPSLGALVAISKSRMSWHLRHVYFGLDHFVLNDALNLNLTESQRRRFHHYLSEQFTLWDTVRGHALLTEAFRNLEHLETVVVRDFNSGKRSRDGPRAKWESYGAPTMRKECGTTPRTHGDPPPHRESSPNYANRVFKAVVSALGAADARPKGLEVFERRGNQLQDYAFHIPPNSDSIISLLHGLKRLHLSLNATCPIHVPNHLTKGFTNPNLCEFLLNCPNIEDLRINEQRNFSRASYESLSVLLKWIAQPSTNNVVRSSAINPPPPGSWPHLRNLSLGMMHVTAGDLLGVIGKFAPSLNHLELWRVNLVPSEGQNVRDIVENKTILWSRFFQNLTDIPNLNPRHVKFGRLYQNIPPSRDGIFMTMAVSVDGKKPSGVREPKQYTGPDWKHYVNHSIIPDLYIRWKDYVLNPPDDDEEEDEDNYEEDPDENDDEDEDTEDDE